MLSFPFLRPALLVVVSLLGFSTTPEVHQFDLTRGQIQSFVFAVDAAGRIDATVEWKGVPLDVRLIGPSGVVAEKAGGSSITLSHVVTSAEVAKGNGWWVALNSTDTKGDLAAVVAGGRVTIEHPVGDIARLKVNAEAKRQQLIAAAIPRLAVVQKQADADEKSQLAQYTLTQQAARSKVQAQMLQHVIAVRKSAAPVAVMQQKRNMVPIATTGVATRVVAGSGTAAPGSTTSTGSTSGSTSSSTTTPPAAPVITSLSSTVLQPGDPLLITGTGFGQSAASVKVRIVLGPGRDLQIGSFEYESDTQIQMTIPATIAGVKENSQAGIFVVTAAGKSPLIPFHFKPTITTSGFNAHPLTANIDEAACDARDAKWATGVFHAGGQICGASGNDAWEPGQQLKNGWTVVRIEPVKSTAGNADVYVTQYHAGTADLSFTMHWWVDFTSSVSYAPKVYIQGPLGVPWN